MGVEKIKISFSSSGGKDVSGETLASIVLHLVHKFTTGDFESLRAQSGVVFVNLYDEDGEEFELFSDKGKVDFVIRDKPYKRKSKNLSEAMKFGHQDTNDNFVVDAYVYERYT